MIKIVKTKTEDSSTAAVVVKHARKKAAKFASQQKWDRLRDLLLTIEEGMASAGGCSHDLAGDRDNGFTFLHVLCAFQPPLDVTNTVVRLFPHMVAARDHSSRVPMHVAVECEAPLDIFDCLMESDPQCVDARNCDGKTPLMLACKEMGSAIKSGFYEGKGKVRWLADVIKLLAKSSPNSILVEDDGGWTALEHALDSEAPKKTIKTLQRATRQAAREQGELERHEHLRKMKGHCHVRKGEDIRSLLPRESGLVMKSTSISRVVAEGA
eukprot:CAMPEP_0197439836 /NCGR_PEP_ID=MMETSP1175-20131217/6494_1 /TAXON_ID=1003142 /ORGANISM="Triceratium dubium, Strain CCMP147" /LENGTH=267 /DNA_ID=CAMNT_0042969827 /DNA_START=90 /DNA_END=893 /DNA_ORIENTATION=-